MSIMADANPLMTGYPDPPPPCSKKTCCISGLLVTVYGLDELQPEHGSGDEVACLWLLHPRTETQACMEPIAQSTIHAWNTHVRNMKPNGKAMGLLAVTFDQRNHGTRQIDSRANEDWRNGNELHAQDMFSNYHGTTMDTSHLMSHIAAYLFSSSERRIGTNLVCGISLGGHAAWQCLFHDSRVKAAISIIGCPDYKRLMSDRALLSRLQTAGPSFLGSKDFPQSLLDVVRHSDPAGMVTRDLWGSISMDDAFWAREPTVEEEKIVHPQLSSSLSGKHLLNMSGADDKLVPYRCSKPFVDWLKTATAPGRWFSNDKFDFDDKVFPGVGHALSPGMAQDIDRFVVEFLCKASGMADKIPSRM